MIARILLTLLGFSRFKSAQKATHGELSDGQLAMGGV